MGYKDNWNKKTYKSYILRIRKDSSLNDDLESFLSKNKLTFNSYIKYLIEKNIYK